MDYEQYKSELCREAKLIQGENYPGDDYYLQDCWVEQFKDGTSAQEAVISDMGYWD